MNSNNVSFFDKVYIIVKKIPHGKVTTVGRIMRPGTFHSGSTTHGDSMRSPPAAEPMPDS